MLLNELIFRIQQNSDEEWEQGKKCFELHKTQELLNEYEKFFTLKKYFHPQNMFELGLWDGGSMVMWSEIFNPKKHVGIDLQQRIDSNYFQEYIKSRGLSNRVKTYWNTDQADSVKLKEIIRDEFGEERLDLVIDDASHNYELTKVSFETLFPLLRPGGVYIIENWAWSHWQGLENIFAGQVPLTQLVFELVELTESSINVVGNLTTYKGFVAIERGIINLKELGNFNLDLL